MKNNDKYAKKGNEFLKNIDNQPVSSVNDIAKLVNSSKLSKPKYKSVKIGDQIWMTENLNLDHYRNGDPIPEVRDPEEWANLKTGAWCYYDDNHTENGKKYGRLYNWYAVDDPRGLAPKGWHIPTKAELETLSVSVGNSGNKLARGDQQIGGGLGANTVGFSALLAGLRFFGEGDFYGLGKYGVFWSSTEGISLLPAAYSMSLWYENKFIDVHKDCKENGFSVRCLKN